MKIKKILSIGSAYLIPAVVMADQIVINIPNPAGKNDNLIKIIQAVLDNIVLPIGAVLVVMYIIYAGFTFITAQGKPKEIEDAKRRFLWSLIGAAILLGASAISQAVQATLSNIVST